VITSERDPSRAAEPTRATDDQPQPTALALRGIAARLRDHPLRVTLRPDRMEIAREDHVALRTHEPELKLGDRELHRWASVAVYHALVPRRLALVSLCLAVGCVDAHFASLRWPPERSGAPRQPVLAATELGLAMRATAIDYEPEAIVVAIELENDGASVLRIERRAITFAWDELEYAVEAPGPDAREPEWIDLAPQATAALRLRYHLGRPLTGPGSRVILRSLTRDGVSVVELPQLELPAMPTG
jgi:hypothetical protein